METPRKTPCASCPFRRDVPSGVWSADEYAILPDYDGDILAQATSEHGMNAFGCHQADGHLCSGWAAYRGDPGELLAVRLGISSGHIDPDTLDYETSVPLFASGAEAAAHGIRDYESPSPEAVAATAKIVRIRARRGDPVSTGDFDVDMTPAEPGPAWEWPEGDDA